MFFVLQIFTAAILILAANTAYPGLPAPVVDPRARPVHAVAVPQPRRPARLLQRDHRPVGCSPSLLIWAFDANLTALIQLYVVGVFIALTLSQAGMVRRWLTPARSRVAAARDHERDRSRRPPASSWRSWRSRGSR